MIPPVVIDASIAASWVIPDERNAAGEKFASELRSRKVQPITVALFWYEFRNILVTNARRGRISADQLSSFLQELRDIGIQTQQAEDDRLILSLALHHNLTAYDAAYLALAVSSNAILATNDRKLARAVIAAGVELRSALPEDVL